MPQTFTITGQGTPESYRYQVGRFQWDGQEADVVVIHAFSIEDGKDVSVDPPPLRDGVLANHPELAGSANPLVIVIKETPGGPVAKWRLVGFWSGDKGPNLRLRPHEIFKANEAELERAFGP